MNRRNFFKNTGALALGALAMPEIIKANGTNLLSAKEIKTVGIQLYSIKDLLEKDLHGTLDKIAKMGYKEVESFSNGKGHYFGMMPNEFSGMLKDKGLNLLGSHFISGTTEQKAESWRQATLVSRFDELVEKAATTGQKHLTCAYLFPSLRTTPDDLKKTAELFNQAGEICHKAGLQFSFHNHAYEFEKVGDSLIFDYLLDNTDPKLVQWEMDVYWVVAAKADPIAYFKKYTNRFTLGHIKDMSKVDTKKNVVIGDGSIDYVSLLKEAKKAGMKHFIVEQDNFSGDVMESMESNCKRLAAYNV
jgi:sugar phosphate isomerase/epimerase